MIKVTVIKAEQKVKSIVVKGHSNSAPKGEDLICAGVSSIVIGGANAIAHPECFTFKTDEGYFEIAELLTANEHDYNVLETMLIQLKTIEETYPKFIQVVEKGN
jgi:uncharacterized protein YsxB (DUF464 family)